jgi:hypothetical protein
MHAENLKSSNGRKPNGHANGHEPVSKQKAAWTPERRAAQAARMKGNRQGKRPRKEKGGKEATVLGVLTFLRHAASSIFGDIRSGEETLRTIPRKDVLVLLAFVDVRDKL